MHKEVLTQKQQGLLPLLKSFGSDFGLAGGSAMALHIGHRQSEDFDLISTKPFLNRIIRDKIVEQGFEIGRVLIDENNEYTILIDGVKLSFVRYPFPVKCEEDFGGLLHTFDLLTLSAMKAYMLGRRAKWKDYVDMFVILTDFFNLGRIVKRAKEIFGGEFDEKIFRASLCYFDDIDYTEEVRYMPGWHISPKYIKKALSEIAVS